MRCRLGIKNHGAFDKAPLTLYDYGLCQRMLIRSFSGLRQSVASVAQLVEQLTLNQLVLGSSPSRGTIFLNDLSKALSPKLSLLGHFLARLRFSRLLASLLPHLGFRTDAMVLSGVMEATAEKV